MVEMATIPYTLLLLNSKLMMTLVGSYGKINVLVIQIFNRNPQRIFSFWVQPPIQEMEIPKFRCRWCDEEFPDDGSVEKFEKFDKPYCSMK